MKSYISVVHDWVYNKRKLADKEELLVDFFKNGFIHTNIPEKVYFGANKSSISFVMGGIYLIACTKSRNIWMIQDKIHKKPAKYFFQAMIESTKNASNPIYWLRADNIDMLKLINENVDIWKSYEKATSIILNTSHGNFVRQDLMKGKDLLKSFWQYGNNNHDFLELEVINDEWGKNVALSKQLSSLERQKRLKKSLKFPQKVDVKTGVYLRNPDVVAESLYRAKGKCEICGCDAPFIKIKDGTPYLEVHHIVALSHGGEDTMENTKSLCPNCHRKQHYGV